MRWSRRAARRCRTRRSRCSTSTTPRADRRARDERPPRPLGLLRRRVLAGRPAGVGLGRRAGRPARLLGDAGRPVRARRPDPGRPFPGGDRLRADAARRPPVRREQPRWRSLHHRAVRGPARPPGDGHQPEHGPDHGHDRPGAPGDPFGVAFNRDATKAYVTNWTGRSVSVIDTSRPARAEDDPALAGRRSAPGRPSDGDRRQPAKRRDLHGQRLERHRERPRLAPRPARRHHRRRPRPGRAEGVDAGGARGQPGRRDALRRRRRRERRRGGRPPHAPRPRVHPDGLVPGRRQGGTRRAPARGREHQRLRRGPEPVRAVLAAPGPGVRHGHRVLAGLLREPVQRHHDPRVGAGRRPARRARVRPPAATVDGGGAPQQPRRRAARAPSRGGVRHPPRHLRDQGEPHLRPGLRRSGQGKRRPLARPVQGRLRAEPARARPQVHAARQLLRRRGGVAGRPPMVDPGDGDRLRRQGLAVRLRLGVLPKLRQRVRAARPAVRVGAAGRRPDGAADCGGRDGGVPVGRRVRPRRQLPRLRRGHAVERPAQLPQRDRVLRPHPPSGPLRRARRPALPRLEPRLLRPRGARARVGAGVSRL